MNILNRNIMATTHLNKADFIKKVADIENNTKDWTFLGDKPALIDFYASWCGPCKRLSPILEEISEEYAGKIDIYKVNVDEEYDLASRFGIHSVPTLIFVPKIGTPQMMTGAASKLELRKAIETMLL